MNLSHNRIPKKVARIHLIAACGTAMGALACMLDELGYEVGGSDHDVYPPMSTFLQSRGIRIARGFSGENLARRPDLVVVGNAVTRDNPEAVAVREMGLDFCSMPQALNHFAARGKRAVVVTGTHGKTTTSALMAWVLASAGRDPSFMIGGLLNNFNANYRLGGGDLIVFEGDEYDTAYFDKGPKFLHYRPAMAVLTGVEYDHADIFDDLSQVMAAFGRFVAAVPAEATLLAYDADANVSRLVGGAACRVLRYGRGKDAYWRVGEVERRPPWTHFSVLRKGRPFGTFRTRLPGDHNLLNILAVIGTAHGLGVSAGALGTALESFAGVKRRQEVRGVKSGVTVMDDFAHHPTAVRETIRAVKPLVPPGGRLVAVFEPRTNTSMRKVFQDVYPGCFDRADLVCIRRPSALWKVPDGQRFSSERLVADLRARGRDARFFADTEALLGFLAADVRAGDLVLVMSNGGFDNIHERLLEML